MERAIVRHTVNVYIYGYFFISRRIMFIFWLLFYGISLGLIDAGADFWKS